MDEFTRRSPRQRPDQQATARNRRQPAQARPAPTEPHPYVIPQEPEQPTMRAPRTPRGSRRGTNQPAKQARQQQKPQAEGGAYTLRAVTVGIAAAGVFVVLFALFLVGGAFAYFHTLGLIMPGVTAGGVDVGGMTVTEAANAINTQWNSSAQLNLGVEDREWQATPAEFGLTVDSAATALRASSVGRDRGMIAEAFVMVDSTFNGTAVAPVVAVDQEKARAALVKWAATIDQAPQNASLKIENGTLVAVPGKQGYSLDVEATLAALTADPGAALRDANLPLVLTPIAPGVPDASAALGQAQALTAAPIQLTIYDAITDENFDRVANPSDIATWLSVESGEDSLDVFVDPAKVAGYLQSVSDGLGEGRSIDPAKAAPEVTEALKGGRPAFILVSHAPTTYTVEQGDTLTSISWTVGMPYWRILDANGGINADSIDVGQTLNIPSKDVLLPLPVIPGKRLVLNITEQRLRGFENKQQVFEYVISTGIDRSPTQPGVFQVQTHEPNAYASLWDLYMPDFMGIYESWPGFMNGFHGLPLLSNGVRLWEDILGRPASYGCIILTLEEGHALYEWAPDGVVVEIVQ